MQPRIPFLLSFLAIAATIAILVAINLYAGSAHAQGPISVGASSGRVAVQQLGFSHAAPAATLPLTSGERSNALVTRAAVGILMLAAGVVSRLLLVRRRALL